MFDPKTPFFQQDAFLKVSILICIFLNHVTRRMFSSSWLLSSAFFQVMSSVKITSKLVTSTLVVTQLVDTYSSTKVPTILILIELFSSGTSHARPRSTTLTLISSLRRMSEGFRSLCINSDGLIQGGIQHPLLHPIQQLALQSIQVTSFSL